MGRNEEVVASRIVRYRVLGEYLCVRTSDNRLYLFYKPSCIGLHTRSYAGAGLVLIIFGVFSMIFGHGLAGARESFFGLSSSVIGNLMLASGILLLMAGIALVFWKERFLLIESHAGTKILFKNPGITDRDVGAIFSRFAEEYKGKPESRESTTKE